MSNYYVCTKCEKPCEVKQPVVVVDARTHPLLSVCCSAIVKARSS